MMVNESVASNSNGDPITYVIAEKVRELIASSQFSEAVVAAETLVGRYPHSGEVHELLGDARRAVGDVAQAASDYFVATGCEGVRSLECYRWGAVTNFEHGHYERANETANRGLRNFPNDALLIGYAGASLHRLHNGNREAVALMRTALRSCPHLWGSFYQTYHEAMITAGLEEDATAELDSAARRLEKTDLDSPPRVSALYYLVKLLRKLERPIELRSVLSQALSALPALGQVLEEEIQYAYTSDLSSDDRASLGEDADRVLDDFRAALLGVLSKQTATVARLPQAIAYLCGARFRITAFEKVTDDIESDLVAKGVDRNFLRFMRQAGLRYQQKAMPPSPSRPWSLDPSVSPRVRDVLDTLQKGNKSTLSPYSFKTVYAKWQIGVDMFLFVDDRSPFIVGQLCEVDRCLADTIWILPAQEQVLIVNAAGIRTPVVHSALADIIARVISAPPAPEDRVDVREIVVAQPLIPHVGHYIWNGISGWSKFFQYSGANCPARLLTISNISSLGDVGDLYSEECLGIPLARVSSPAAVEEEISRGNFVLFLKDNFVHEELARRVINWARKTASSDFVRRLRDIRSRSYPLILVNIRLENRSWIDQESGFINVLRSLVEKAPGLGILIDGINGGVTQGWTHASMSIDDELMLSERIATGVQDLMPVMNTVGCSISESLMAGEMADFFISHVGAGMAKYRWINNRGGVAFSNELFSQPGHRDGRLYDSYRECSKTAKHVPLDSISDLTKSPGDPRANFNMDWRDLLETVVDYMVENELLTSKT